MTTDPRRPRIFCIGLNKTGTSTLDEALQQLGFTTLHWGGTAHVDSIRAAIAAGEPALSPVDDSIDAFSDIGPISKGFDRLDDQYPGSKFILTVRDLDDWLDSRQRHVEKNQRKAADGRYDGRWLTVDIDMWVSEYHRHHDRVRSYFADRPDDLLELDIPGGDGWDKLCPFLDRPEPDHPFPWANQYTTQWKR